MGQTSCRHTIQTSCFAAILSSVILGGCASTAGPDAQSSVGQLPDAWTTDAAASEIETEWWRRFNDQRLTSLINEAQRLNTGIGQAEAREQQALAQAEIAGADRLPQLSGAFNASRQKQPVPGGSSSGGSAITENYGASLNIAWEIDLWGRIGAQSQAAREEYLASADTLRSVRQSIAAQTAKAYFAVIEARQQVAFSEKTVAALAETARQVGNRADEGIISPADKQLAITNLESARGGLQQRLDVEQRVSRELETLLRDYPAGKIKAPDALPSIPDTPPAGLPAELLLRRPDISAAERNLRATGLRTEAARKAFLPSITLTGSAGRQSNDLDNLLDGGFSVWSLAGEVIQPIFQGGRLSASLDLAKARQEEAAEAYAETVLQALREVEDALAAERHLADRVASLKAASQAAENARRVALNRYEQGLTPFITVLESQQRALDTKSAWLAARRARLDNRVDLHLALGGSFGASKEKIR